MKMLVTLLISTYFFAINPANANTVSIEPITENTIKYVEFTLRNNSLKSIPLIIPSVMKPSLSPKSNSGVGLKVGQEVLFRYKGKKHVLLVVTKDLEGQTIEVSKLLKAKKKEIDTKKKK